MATASSKQRPPPWHLGTICVFGLVVASHVGSVVSGGSVCGKKELFTKKSSPGERIPAVCETLKLNKMMLGDDGTGAIAAELEGNTAVTRLWMDGCSIRATGIGWLSKLLRDPHCSLRELHIDSNQFGPNGVRWLATALETNTGLRELSMRWNSIRTAEAKVLANAIKRNKAIRVLKLHGNKLGDAGAAAFADAFLVNTALEVVLLGSNNIGTAGAKLLAASMGVNAAITELSVTPSATLTDKDLLTEIAKACAVNKAKDSDEYSRKLRVHRAAGGADADPVVTQIQLDIDAFQDANCKQNPKDCSKPKDKAKAADAKDQGKEEEGLVAAAAGGKTEATRAAQDQGEEGAVGSRANDAEDGLTPDPPQARVPSPTVAADNQNGNGAQRESKDGSNADAKGDHMHDAAAAAAAAAGPPVAVRSTKDTNDNEATSKASASVSVSTIKDEL